MAGEEKNNKIKNAYDEVVNKLSLKINGFTADMQDKILSVDTDKPEILDVLFNTFNHTENTSITDVKWKKNGEELSTTINKKFDDNLIKQNLQVNLPFFNAEKIREQLYLLRYMPQVRKILEAKVNAVMSPNTHTKERVDLVIKDESVLISDIKTIMRNKESDRILKETLMASYSHGSSFMYVYPYSNIAKDIMDMQNHAMFQASKTGDTTTTAVLFGESFNPTTADTKEFLLTEAGLNAVLKMRRDTALYSESGVAGVKRTGYVLNDAMIPGVIGTFKVRHGTSLFSESSEIIDTLNNTNLDGNGKVKSKSKKSKLDMIVGCHIEKLENDKVIPIYVTDQLVGVYYIESTENRYESMTSYNLLEGNTNNNIRLDMQLKLDIVAEMKTEISEKFLVDNKNILHSLDSIMRDVSLSPETKIRFIPREYLVEFPHHNRISAIHDVEPYMHYFINLFKNYILKKLYYEKDKIITYYTVDGDDDMTAQAYEAMEIVKRMYPSPADLLNLREIHSSLQNIHNIFVPKSPQGNKAVEFELKEGQKAVEGEFEDLLKVESMVTTLLGFNYSMLDPTVNADFALNIIASDANKAESVLVDQTHYNMYLQELYEKVMKYEIPGKSIDMDVKFPEQRVFKMNLFNDLFNTITARIQTTVDAMNPADSDEKKAFIKRQLFIDWASTLIDTEKYLSYEEQFDREAKRKANSSGGETDEML